MAKYSYDFKKQVIQDYKDGKSGFVFPANKYGIPTKTIVQEWVCVYEKFDDDGLRRCRKNNF